VEKAEPDLDRPRGIFLEDFIHRICYAIVVFASCPANERSKIALVSDFGRLGNESVKGQSAVIQAKHDQPRIQSGEAATV
jgi:hypothetical protein